MSLRQNGIQWLEQRHGPFEDPVHVSKLYRADESWNKKPVWWFEFAESVLDDDKVACVHLVCQLIGEEEPFVHLRVRTEWLLERKSELHIRPKRGVSLYISAAQGTLFQEQRGSGRLDFSGFVD